MLQTTKQQTGTWGEEIAARFLVDHGYTIIERNYFARVGEIDIIARVEKPVFGNTLCFIEVKTRKRADGSAERATDVKKQAKIRAAAERYCQRQGIDVDNTPICFEHVSVVGSVDTYDVTVYELPV